MDAQDIPPVSKRRNLLSGERYHRQFIDEHQNPLHPANCRMSSSSDDPGSSTVIRRELELFYDTPVVCGCSKCQVLKENPLCVTLTHYKNDKLPIVYGLIPPTVVNNPIGDIEKTRMNTSLCSFLKMLEAKTTMSHSKLTNPSAYLQSTEIFSDPKYDMNATQSIITRRSKKLHELRENVQVHTKVRPIVGG